MQGMKQHKDTTLTILQVEVQHGSHWVKAMALAGLPSFVEALVENLFLWLFQFLEVAFIPWVRFKDGSPSLNPAIAG